VASRLETVSTVVMALCAVVVTGWLLVARPPLGRAPAPASSVPTAVPDWKILATDGNRVGPRGVEPDLVVFTDYQCPWCRVLEERLDTLRSKHVSDLVVVYRHLPILQLHPFAREAALSAECAAEQDRFVEMHSELFAAQDSVGVLAWASFAKRSGVPDVSRFESCLEDPDVLNRIVRDEAEGKKLGIRGTPVVIAGGFLHRGALAQPQLDSVVLAGRR